MPDCETVVTATGSLCIECARCKKEIGLVLK
jgi:hypothetical protein